MACNALAFNVKQDMTGQSIEVIDAETEDVVAILDPRTALAGLAMLAEALSQLDLSR